MTTAVSSRSRSNASIRVISTRCRRGPVLKPQRDADGFTCAVVGARSAAWTPSTCLPESCVKIVGVTIQTIGSPEAGMSTYQIDLESSAEGFLVVTLSGRPRPTPSGVSSTSSTPSRRRRRRCAYSSMSLAFALPS
jgi:hypothetical protein